ncbi:hypothetical protein CDAR_296081 [Caerostris darwini]|uniref:Uncharacterized protein n=1 Tax=Caerostris darwini TaxID=1538125 RepID=A0AAV4SWF7_9ARAC|nr:hypothetical protein CDAR_296081 [Caerostris darwini]
MRSDVAFPRPISWHSFVQDSKLVFPRPSPLQEQIHCPQSKRYSSRSTESFISLEILLPGENKIRKRVDKRVELWRRTFFHGYKCGRLLFYVWDGSCRSDLLRRLTEFTPYLLSGIYKINCLLSGVQPDANLCHF